MKAVRCSILELLFVRTGRVSVGVGGGGEVKKRVGWEVGLDDEEDSGPSWGEADSLTPRVFSKSSS